MRVGVPSEVKQQEYRVAITPAGVQELVRHGHSVVIQAGAGRGSRTRRQSSPAMAMAMARLRYGRAPLME